MFTQFKNETKETILNNTQIKSNEWRNKRKHSDSIEETNKKTKIVSINYERFEELNNKYEKIFCDWKKKIEDLKNENKELHKGSIIIIENLQDDKEELLYKIEKIKEEKYEVEERFNELSNMIIFLRN